jgi:hypothetical protein
MLRWEDGPLFSNGYNEDGQLSIQVVKDNNGTYNCYDMSGPNGQTRLGARMTREEAKELGERFGVSSRIKA